MQIRSLLAGWAVAGTLGMAAAPSKAQPRPAEPGPIDSTAVRNSRWLMEGLPACARQTSLPNEIRKACAALPAGVDMAILKSEEERPSGVTQPTILIWPMNPEFKAVYVDWVMPQRLSDCSEVRDRLFDRFSEVSDVLLKFAPDLQHDYQSYNPLTQDDTAALDGVESKVHALGEQIGREIESCARLAEKTAAYSARYSGAPLTDAESERYRATKYKNADGNLLHSTDKAWELAKSGDLSASEISTLVAFTEAEYILPGAEAEKRVRIATYSALLEPREQQLHMNLLGYGAAALLGLMTAMNMRRKA